MAAIFFIYTYIGKTFFLSETRRPWPLIFGYIASSSSHVYSTIRLHAIMLLSSTPSLSSENIHFQQILNKHSPMKRNILYLEYTRDNDTQASELGPSGPSCYYTFREIRGRLTNNINPDQNALSRTV